MKKIQRYISLGIVIVGVLALTYIFTHTPPYWKIDDVKYDAEAASFTIGRLYQGRAPKIEWDLDKQKITGIVLGQKGLLQKWPMVGNELRLIGYPIMTLRDGQIVKIHLITDVHVIGRWPFYLLEDTYDSGVQLKPYDLVIVSSQPKKRSLPDGTIPYAKAVFEYLQEQTPGVTDITKATELMITTQEVTRIMPPAP